MNESFCASRRDTGTGICRRILSEKAAALCTIEDSPLRISRTVISTLGGIHLLAQSHVKMQVDKLHIGTVMHVVQIPFAE